MCCPLHQIIYKLLVPIKIVFTIKKPCATSQHFGGRKKKNPDLMFAHYKLNKRKIFKVTGVFCVHCKYCVKLALRKMGEKELNNSD